MPAKAEALSTTQLHECPTCGTHVAAPVPLSRRQDALVDNLIDPKYTTIYAAAKAAGYSESSCNSYVTQIGVKLRKNGAIAARKKLRLDKASGQRKLATRLLESAAQDVDRGVAKMDTATKIQLGGSLQKLALETEAHLGGRDEGKELSLLKVRVIRRRLRVLQRLARAVLNGSLTPTMAESIINRCDTALSRIS